MFSFDRDIIINGPGLWLDARRKKDFSFVSHAHSDHTCRHERTLATPATLALARERERIRREARGMAPRRENGEDVALPFGKPLRLDGAQVMLYPAGHILGSAQILVHCELHGRTLLYSGDFCPERTAAAEEIEIPHADTLVMECTYGLPEHRFPPREEVIRQLHEFVEKTLESGRTPVLQCYALGKGQEVMRLLCDGGYPVAAEEETWALAQVYGQFGVDFPNCRRLAGGVRPGEAIVTPSVKSVVQFLAGCRIRTAAVTGWAVGGYSWRAGRADARIPLSDHADFDGLLRYVKAVDPEEVYIVHGPEEFAGYLTKAGYTVKRALSKE